MISEIRNLLFRIFFHNMNVLKQGETSPSFTIPTLRAIQIFPASKIREQAVYLFYYSSYSTVFAFYSMGKKENAAGNGIPFPVW